MGGDCSSNYPDDIFGESTAGEGDALSSGDSKSASNLEDPSCMIVVI